MIPEKDELMHYASKYYDPVKAHEYYMRTRELKGRSSSSSSSESSSSSSTGAGTSGSSKSSSSSSGSFQEEYERYTFGVNLKIEKLRQRLGRMSKEAKMLMADEIYAEINALKEENMNKKYELKAKYGSSSGSSSSGKGVSDSFIQTNRENYKALKNS